MYIVCSVPLFVALCCSGYGAATGSRLCCSVLYCCVLQSMESQGSRFPKLLGVFCKKVLQKKGSFQKELSNLGSLHIVAKPY